MAATSAHLKKAAVSETKKKNGKKPFYCDLPQLPVSRWREGRNLLGNLFLCLTVDCKNCVGILLRVC